MKSMDGANQAPQDNPSEGHIPASAKIGSQGRFRKVLSLGDIYFICLGSEIGSAWLFGSIYGASIAGPAAIISWLIGGAFILVIVVTWAEVGGILPSTGAVVKIPQYTHGYFSGFYFGWAYYISAVLVPPVESVAIVTYASAYLPSLLHNGSLAPLGYAVCILIMGLTFLLNSYGVRLLVRINNVITWWKLLVPTITIIVVLLYLYPPNFTSFGGFTPHGIGPIFSAVGTAGIVFAYAGSRTALDYSGEARNPTRDVPRAMIFSILTTIVLYTMLQTAFIGGIRWASSGLQPGNWANLATQGVYSSAPFYRLIIVLGIPILATVLLFDAVISPFGTTGVYTGSSARDLYALAEGGHLSNRMSDVHKKYGIPRTALIINLFIGMFFLFAFPNWGQLATIGTTATIFTQLAGATSLTALRKNAPQLKRRFKVPAARIIAPVAFVMSSLIVYWTTWPYTGYAMIALLIGMVLFMIARSRGSYPVSDIRHGVWIVAYSVALTILSYLGSYGIGLIKFPWDFGMVGVMAIICYYWGVHSSYKTDGITKIMRQEEVEKSLNGAEMAEDKG